MTTHGGHGTHACIALNCGHRSCENGGMCESCGLCRGCCDETRTRPGRQFG